MPPRSRRAQKSTAKNSPIPSSPAHAAISTTSSPRATHVRGSAAHSRCCAIRNYPILGKSTTTSRCDARAELMFKKILIANRGEIACRVIATAKRMGIKTVAVYSDADADALHVRLADEAVRIGPPKAAESYLDIARLVAACRETGAE